MANIRRTTNTGYVRGSPRRLPRLFLRTWDVSVGVSVAVSVDLCGYVHECCQRTSPYVFEDVSVGISTGKGYRVRECFRVCPRVSAGVSAGDSVAECAAVEVTEDIAVDIAMKFAVACVMSSDMGLHGVPLLAAAFL